jgi:hypothetical protein
MDCEDPCAVTQTILATPPPLGNGVGSLQLHMLRLVGIPAHLIVPVAYEIRWCSKTEAMKAAAREGLQLRT